MICLVTSIFQALLGFFFLEDVNKHMFTPDRTLKTNSTQVLLNGECLLCLLAGTTADTSTPVSLKSLMVHSNNSCTPHFRSTLPNLQDRLDSREVSSSQQLLLFMFPFKLFSEPCKFLLLPKTCKFHLLPEPHKFHLLPELCKFHFISEFYKLLKWNISVQKKELCSTRIQNENDRQSMDYPRFPKY